MLIRETLEDIKSMSDVEQQLANFFMDNADILMDISARKVADILFVSPSTVIRFCQKLGYTGFPDFREAFLKEKTYLERRISDVDVNEPFNIKDSIWSIANNLRQLYIETIEDTLEIQDYRELEKSVHILTASQHIYILFSR